MNMDLFREIALLSHLTDDDRDRVIAVGAEQRLAKGAILFHEGEGAEAAFVLLEGRLKLVRYSEKGRELLIHLVKPGQSFAEAALFGSGTYPATAEAVEDSVCWSLPRRQLLDIVRKDPELGFAMMASMSMWTRRMASQLQLLTQRRVEERLAVYLLALTGGGTVARGDFLSFGAPKHLVAAQCGTAPEVLSRTFKKLEDAGIFEVGADGVTVLEPAKLRALAEWIG